MQTRLRTTLHTSAAAAPADPGEVGGKAHGLQRLVRAGVRVPPFLVVPAGVFDAVVGDAGLPADDAEAERRRGAVRRAPLPEGLADEVAEALRTLGMEDGPLAVRSSAVGEDGGRSSFAGQFDTVLGVRADGDGAALWEAVRRVWASAFGAHALEYRRARGERVGGMAVVVQRMVEPAVSGVAFSVDPVRGDAETAVVSAVYGLGEGLVSGALDADTYRVRFSGDGGSPVVGVETAHKDRAFRGDGAGGVRTVEVEVALRDAPALSDAEAVEVARAARTLAERLGGAQDVEWALAPGPDGPRTLWLLQARPVTASAAAPRPVGGERRVWDNYNIVESYPGVTLPLSYSVARDVFGDVYVQLCEAAGAPPERIEAERGVFRELFGLVRGRVRYNMENRHRVLLMIPGMVRVGDEVGQGPMLPDAGEPRTDGLPPALILAARTLRLPGKVLTDTVRVRELNDELRRRVRDVLDPLVAEDLSGRTPDALRGVYERIDREVFSAWHGPMLNDLVLERWTGVLMHLVQTWMPGTPPALVNQLVVGGGDIVSTEPVRRLAAAAAACRADDASRALLEGPEDDAAVWRRLREEPAFAAARAALDAHLAEFGDRCSEELKLEAPTYADEPELLVRMLRGVVRAGAAGGGAGEGAARLRAEAEARVRSALTPARQTLFFGVLETVRELTRNRENLRFERTRAFGVLRRLFREMGRRLADGGALDDPADVFYLTVDELRHFLAGTAGGGTLRPRVAARRAEFARYAELPEPPDRFVTHGPPALSAIEPYRSDAPPPRPLGMPEPPDDGALRGMGCCPGVVRAPVRVVRDPREAGDLAGRILVAEQTDPGWTLLFPAARGVLVQRGSLLSHAAIVAREMGIPCVVGIPDLLAELEDGEVVEMDGAEGTVRRVGTSG